MSRKCHQCGLVNWDHDENCKRCGASWTTTTPSAHKWYTAYCIFMALLYFLTCAAGIVFLIANPDPRMDATEATFMGSLLLVLGVVFFVPYAVAPFLPRKSWVWVFGLVLICIGLTSACLLPVCIPLLLAWLKPEMKEYYGRTVNPLPPLTPQWT